MPGTLSGSLVVTSSTNAITLTELKAECTLALSKNTPARWADADLTQAFKDALRAVAPLGVPMTLTGSNAADAHWTIDQHIVRVLRLRLSSATDMMEVPVGAVDLTLRGPFHSAIRLPYGGTSYSVVMEAIALFQYDTSAPTTVIQYPWVELLKYYMLAALYEQRIDLTGPTDTDDYQVGAQMWRTRADIRKQEIMATLGMLPEPPAPADKKKR
jgi:hypothetical protein